MKKEILNKILHQSVLLMIYEGLQVKYKYLIRKAPFSLFDRFSDFFLCITSVVQMIFVNLKQYSTSYVQK